METIQAPEAARRLSSEAGYRYVDVRSEQEFAQGHPAGAYNVPIMQPDPTTGMMRPNPSFLAVMEAHFPTDARLILGCQVGGRSAAACDLLERAGYQHVANMDGGWGGRADAHGTLVAPGWATLSLPVDEGSTPYAELHSALGE